jgi:uncharacterized FAD-dependent dehydrogenase
VIIVGAGPAGIFCALKLVHLGIRNILLIDKGKDIIHRQRRGKAIVCGWGGAGAFSDGKITLSPEVGGFLGDYLDRESLLKVLHEVDSIYLKFGAPCQVHSGPSDELDDLKNEACRAGMELIPTQVRHMGTENCRHVLGKLREALDSKVDVLTETHVANVLFEQGSIAGVVTEQNEKITGHILVCAPGRVGAQWMREEAKRLQLESHPNPVDIGLRIETPASVLAKLTDVCYEAKLVAYPQTFEDRTRTFCMNPYGEVVLEEVNGLKTVNGHSYSGRRTDNTNFALLVSASFTEPFDDPIRYGKDIAELANMLGQGVIIQRLGDLLQGRRSTPARVARSTTRPTLQTAVPGDLSFVLPYRFLKSIVEMLEAMEQLTPGLYSRDTLLYGVEVKFYSNRISLTSELETQIPNLFAIGDGAGITRGLLQSSASGLRAGEVIAARLWTKREGYLTQRFFALTIALQLGRFSSRQGGALPVSNTRWAVFSKVAGFASIFGLILNLLGLWKAESPFYLWLGVALVFALTVVWHLVSLGEVKKSHKTAVQKLELVIREKDEHAESLLIQAEEAVDNLFCENGNWLHKIAHEIRDRYMRLIQLARKEEPPITDTIESEAEITSQNVVNYLEELFTFRLKEQIAVSIKTMDKDAEGKEVAITLARSTHSGPGRKKRGDVHPVTPENTAFWTIRSGEERFFGKTDLLKEQAAGNYHNTNPRWQQQYKSAIVVPIRSENPDYVKGQTDRFLLRGFLCIDVNSTTVFKEEMLEAYAHMMMAAGDDLCVYLDLVKRLQELK